MLLSIIIPVYNMAADNKLKHCLDSCLNQSIEKYEIIAVDDASTDDSLSILKEYEAEYPGIVKVIASERNLKQGGAKNLGLNAASGKWVGFVDSDDWVSPDMYKKLISKAEETGADLVGCDYTRVDHYTFDQGINVNNNTENQTGILDRDKHGKLILQFGSMVVKIYLREIIVQNKLSFPEGIFYEDNCAAQVWSIYFNHFEYINEPLYYYLTNPDSTTHHISWEKCLDRMDAGQQFIDYFRNNGKYLEYKNEVDYRFTELYYINTLFSYMNNAEKRKPEHANIIKQGIIRNVPDFMNNPYYMERASEEYKKLIKMQMSSNMYFFTYYASLLKWRDFKKSKA